MTPEAIPAEQRLRESQLLYHSLVDQLPQCIFRKDPDGRLTFVNQRFCLLLGRPPDELVGLTDFDLFPRELAEKYRRDDLRVMESGEVFEDIETHHPPNKEKIFVQVVKIPLRDPGGRISGVQGIFWDVSDHHRAEEHLRESLSLLKATMESTADGLLVVNREGKVVSFNQRFVVLWKIPGEVLATKDDHQLLGFVLDQLADPQGFLHGVEELYGHPERESFDVLAFKDGRLFERYSQPQRIGDQVAGRVWSFRDITERKKAEEERLRLERHIQQAQRLESLGVMAGGIAHDFNNILMAIIGNAQLAISQLSPSAPVQDALREIEKSAWRAAELAKQMLAYSGKGAFAIQALDLARVVRETALLLEASIPKRARLEQHHPGLLPEVAGDVAQIRQIITNLVINAAEALGDAAGVITISTGVRTCDRAFLDDGLDVVRAGHPTPLAEGPYVFLEVADNGSGMNPDVLKKIFDPFFTTKFVGRGLGLPAVLGIVRGHAGTIKVRTAAGQGATFQVFLPVSRQRLPIRAEPKPEAGAPKTVLVVDDERAVGLVAKRVLERLGLTVLTADDGQEAVELFRERGGEIGCVLLDLSMPRLDGERTFQELRRLQPGVKVILCSGYSEVEASQRFASQGLDGFLQKPYDLKLLREKMTEIYPGLS